MSHAELLLLLHKQWSGEITPEEQERLEGWLQASPEWAARAALYRLIWEKASPPQTTWPEMDLDAEFDRLLARIEAAEAQRQAAQRVKRVFIGQGWRVAAAVLLLFGVVWLVRPRPTPETISVQALPPLPEREMRLPDGTLVHLRQNATLSYQPETFARKERRVRLQGEALFTVQPQARKPFIVENAWGAEVEVLGTQFDVRADSDQLMVLVCEGRVQLWPQGKNSGKGNVVLQVRDKALCKKGEDRLQIVKIPFHLNDLAWRTHRLDFRNEPLREVIAALEDYYKADIEVQPPSMLDCRYSGHYYLDTLDLEKMLRGLCRIYRFQAQKLSSVHHRLTGGSCPGR
jgi:ferric-dicitrate binding protein FerR (iron transport regulator)